MTCALFSSVVLNPEPKTLPPNCCGKLSNLCKKQTNYLSQGVSYLVRLKECKVVFENISSSCDAVEPWMLSSSPENNHMTDSYFTDEETALLNLKLKMPIAWGKLNDKQWIPLDDAVSSKLSNCTTLSRTVTAFEETIYAEASTIFGHLPPPKQNLAGLSHRTKHCINLIKEKNLLPKQIKFASMLEQQQRLQQLLIVVRTKTRVSRKPEKSRKGRWQIKKAKNSFKINLNNAGKTLLDSKKYTTVKVDQILLDAHK